MWLSEVLCFLEDSHTPTHRHPHTVHRHTPCSSKFRPVWTCWRPAEIEGKKKSRERWLWRREWGDLKDRSIPATTFWHCPAGVTDLDFISCKPIWRKKWQRKKKTSLVSSNGLLKSQSLAVGIPNQMCEFTRPEYQGKCCVFGVCLEAGLRCQVSVQKHTAVTVFQPCRDCQKVKLSFAAYT